MSEHSSNLMLPFLAAGQAQKHVTVNESLLLLDALTQARAAQHRRRARTPRYWRAQVLPDKKPDAPGM